MLPRSFAAALFVPALAVVPARAQEVVTPPALPVAAEVAPPPAAKMPRWRTEVDLGYVSTAGNSRLRTLNVAEQVAYAPGAWRFGETFSIVNAFTNDSETAATIKVALRADYAVGTRFRLFVLGDYTRDRFAGLSRRFEEAAGLAYGLLTGPRNVLDLEAGLGRTQQTPIGLPTQQYWVSREAMHYKLNFTPKAFFEQRAELLNDLQNPKNLLVNTESDVVAPVLANVGLKVDYTVRFANVPPTAGVKKTDTVLSTSLQILL